MPGAVDQEMLDVPKRPNANLYPGEVVTLAFLLAIKGGGTRAVYHWRLENYIYRESLEQYLRR